MLLISCSHQARLVRLQT